MIIILCNTVGLKDNHFTSHLFLAFSLNKENQIRSNYFSIVGQQLTHYHHSKIYRGQAYKTTCQLSLNCANFTTTFFKFRRLCALSLYISYTFYSLLNDSSECCYLMASYLLVKFRAISIHKFMTSWIRYNVIKACTLNFVFHI